MHTFDVIEMNILYIHFYLLPDVHSLPRYRVIQRFNVVYTLMFIVSLYARNHDTSNVTLDTSTKLCLPRYTKTYNILDTQKTYKLIHPSTTKGIIPLRRMPRCYTLQQMRHMIGQWTPRRRETERFRHDGSGSRVLGLLNRQPSD